MPPAPVSDSTAPSWMVLPALEEGEEPDEVDVDLPQAARTSARISAGTTNSAPGVRRIRPPMRDSWTTTAGNGTNFLGPSPETDSARASSAADAPAGPREGWTLPQPAVAAWGCSGRGRRQAGRGPGPEAGPERGGRVPASRPLAWAAGASSGSAGRIPGGGPAAR